MKTILNTLLVIGLAAFAPLAARAQDEAPPPMPAAPTFTPAQLDQLMGPVALYPDPLISVLLPAASLPTQIVMADRYVSDGGDPNAIDQQGWDPSVAALAHYPEVLKWMDDNLAWTTQVGQAFQGQQQDVMDSVQRLRTDAYNLGNLQSTPQQQIVDDNGYIEILPANPDDVYVPDYQPQQVYYEAPYGTPYITFGVGFIIGPWLCCDFDWWHHRLCFWDHDHPRPANWWHRTPRDRNDFFSHHTPTVWTAPHRPTFSGFNGDRGYQNQRNNQPGHNVGNHNAVNVGNHNTGNIDNHNAGNFGNHPVRNTTPANQNPHLWNAPTLNRPAPQPTEHSSPSAPRNDTSIWNQNANDARAFSQRGQESTHAESHPSSSGGGSSGGGGSRNSGGGGGGGFHSSGGGGGGGNGGGGNNRR